MAATKIPADAFNYVKRYIKNMPLDQVLPQILDSVNKHMWMSAPWRWTVGTFPNITLASSTQDYTASLPSDFLFLLDAYETDQAGNIPRVYTIEPWLNPGGLQGQPSSIAIVSGSPGGSGTVRLYPQPGSIPANVIILSRYKKQAPTITPSNMTTAGVLVMDDEWFDAYISGVLYYGYLFADDQRAGSAQIDSNSGKIVYSGQRGEWEANIEFMRQREKLITLHSPPEAPKDGQ